MSAPELLLDGRYSVGEVLGKGGMGIVRRARDLELDRPVAIKLLQGFGGPRYQEDLARFEREATTLASLSHPGIVDVYAFGVDEYGAPYLVMHLLEGGPPSPFLDLPEVRAGMRQLASGLQCLHDRGLVHRDVKPSNVLRKEDGSFVLIDFGLVYDPSRTALTMEGALPGTPTYLSPERLAGEAATPASDWYAWGVTYFELAEGRAPFSPAEILAHLKGAPRATLLFASLPEGSPEARVIRACLAPDPAARPRDQAALEVLLDGATSSRGRAAPPRPKRAPATTAAARLPASGPAPAGLGWAHRLGLAAAAALVGSIGWSRLASPPATVVVDAAPATASELAALVEAARRELRPWLPPEPEGRYDPERWGMDLAQLRQPRRFRLWLAEGGRPEATLDFPTRELEELAEALATRGIPSPFEPAARARPARDAVTLPEELAGASLVGVGAGELAEGWFSRALLARRDLLAQTRAFAGTQEERRRLVAELGPLPRALAPIPVDEEAGALEQELHELWGSPQARQHLLGLASRGGQLLGTIAYAGLRSIEEEPGTRERVAWVLSRVIEEQRAIFYSHLASAPPELVVVRQPQHPAGWLLVGEYLRGLRRVRRHLDLEALDLEARVGEAYLRALEAAPPGPAGGRRLGRALRRRMEWLVDRDQAGRARRLYEQHQDRREEFDPADARWCRLASLR